MCFPRDDADGLSVVLAARFSIYLSIYLSDLVPNPNPIPNQASDVHIAMSASVDESTAGYLATFPPGPPLPPPPPDEDEWAEAQTEAGETYYYHLVTGETAWEPPQESR